MEDNISTKRISRDCQIIFAIVFLMITHVFHKTAQVSVWNGEQFVLLTVHTLQKWFEASCMRMVATNIVLLSNSSRFYTTIQM